MNAAITPVERAEQQFLHATSIVAVIFALCVAAFAIWQAVLRIPQYFELDYGEGFVWNTVAELLAGRIYRPIEEYPHVMTHYTPVYYAVVAVLSKLGFDPLLAGRLVSLVAGGALLGAVALLAARAIPPAAPRRLRFVAGLVAASVLAGMPVFLLWSTMMRVDMLAMALSTMGLVALQRRAQGRRWLFWAGACFLMALLTKQNTVAPLIAGVAALAIVERGTAVRFTAALAATGLAVVLAAEAATQGEFLRHNVLYVTARFSWDQFAELGLLGLLLAAIAAVPLLVAAIFSVKKLWQIRQSSTWRDEPAPWTVIALSVDLAVGLVLSLGIGKIGGNLNYMLPLLIPAAALAGAALVEVPRSWAPLLVWALALSLVGGFAVFPFQSRAHLAKHDQAGRALLGIVRATPGPVLSEDITLLMRAGRPMPWEFTGITELSRLGIFDEDLVVQRLDRGWFDILIVNNWKPLFFTDEVKNAAQRRYQQVSAVGIFQIWQRRAP